MTDAVKNITTDLTLADYTFEAEAGTIEGRFTLTFSFAPELPTDVFTPEASKIIVSSQNQTCVIDNLTIGENVMIFDATGCLVYSETTNTNTINIALNRGTYIVRQANNWAKFVVK